MIYSEFAKRDFRVPLSELNYFINKLYSGWEETEKDSNPYLGLKFALTSLDYIMEKSELRYRYEVDLITLNFDVEGNHCDTIVTGVFDGLVGVHFIFKPFISDSLNTFDIKVFRYSTNDGDYTIYQEKAMIPLNTISNLVKYLILYSDLCKMHAYSYNEIDKGILKIINSYQDGYEHGKRAALKEILKRGIVE